MDHDLGAMFPVRPGTDRTLFNALYGPLNYNKLCNAYLANEIAIAINTPDLELEHWTRIMSWGPPTISVPIIITDHHLEQARLNALSITIEDGLDWIRTILMRKPYYRGSVPKWTRRALREIRHAKNFTNKDLQHFLGAKSYSATTQWVGDKR